MRLALGLFGLWSIAIDRWQATGILQAPPRSGRNRLRSLRFTCFAAILFLHQLRRANTPLLRQQLKWLTRGALLAVAAFHAALRHAFLFDIRMPGSLTKLAGLSLVFLPLTFCWAIIRYRLMDTDLIFKRGVAYTLATATLVGATSASSR